MTCSKSPSASGLMIPRQRKVLDLFLSSEALSEQPSMCITWRSDRHLMDMDLMEMAMAMGYSEEMHASTQVRGIR